ncbi:tetratricopeptide repeat protein [Rhizobium mesoamericanum]|uniref:tetratricopeptide repeat protein n=1 Tax=Rhizobium mesoamericanum TaxID=1079800 RepID=UPI0003FDD0C6|nr:tetratricopeptide repeat protein [Rhizobium mesoamericanum]
MKRYIANVAVLGVIGLDALFAAGSAISALTAVPAFAIDNIESTNAPDLTQARAKIAAGDYQGARDELRRLAVNTQQADVYNLLGFTLRKTGDYRTSLTYYTKALELAPDHKAAREYLGELYVETGDMAKANEQLTRLTSLCPSGCEERDDLAKAIAAKIAQTAGN